MRNMGIIKPYYSNSDGSLYQGDALAVLKELPDESVNCCVTSPPYWGLRDYSVEGQLGLERTPEEYVAKMVEVFREVRRVLRNDGTLWLNLGDSYWRNPARGNQENGGHAGLHSGRTAAEGMQHKFCDMPEKNMIGIPWRVAFALQSDGWILRQDIIWHKPNPMPESVTDRCTKAHEYIFLMSKSQRYYYDAEAIREDGPMYIRKAGGYVGFDETHTGQNQKGGFADKDTVTIGRNRRSVWTVSTAPFSGAHFATFPPKLIEPCILAGCPEKVCAECGSPWERVLTERAGGIEGDWHSKRKTDGFVNTKPSGQKAWNSYVGPQTIGFQPTCTCNSDTKPGVVLDPFMGAATTAIVAYKHGRKFLGIELSQKYLDEISIPRIEAERRQLKLF